MTNRLKRRVGQPGGKVWSIYNRGPATIKVNGSRTPGSIFIDLHVLHPDCIVSFYSRPVVQVQITDEDKSANFSVVTYF